MADDDNALLAGLHDGAWLDGQTFEPLKYAVPGLIPEGLTLGVGPPKVGKSWLFADLLLSVASGGTTLGKIGLSSKRVVLNLALEDGDRRMQSRCRTLLGDGGSIPPLYHYVTTVPPGRDALQVIAAFLRRHPDTAMVVLDTLGKVMPQAMPGESAYQRDYRIGTRLKALADEHPGLALVVIHHDRKASYDDFIEAVSGTNGLAGAADTVMVICRKRQQQDGLLKVTGRDVPEAEYAVTLKDGFAWQLDGADLIAAAKRARERAESAGLAETTTNILEFVRQHPQGVRAKDVAERFGENAYQYLSRQEKEGRLIKPTRGLYLVPPTSVSEPSEVSESQLKADAESDTGEDVSETEWISTLRRAGITETPTTIEDLSAASSAILEMTRQPPHVIDLEGEQREVRRAQIDSDRSVARELRAEVDALHAERLKHELAHVRSWTHTAPGRGKPGVGRAITTVSFNPFGWRVGSTQSGYATGFEVCQSIFDKIHCQNTITWKIEIRERHGIRTHNLCDEHFSGHRGQERFVVPSDFDPVEATNAPKEKNDQ